MREQDSHNIKIEGDVIDFRVDASLIPGIEREIFGTTVCDSEIDKLSIPQRPIWLALVVRVLKWYRVTITHHLGNRCVFEPSCSRYSEMAFRKYGFLRGVTLTADRLYRCRPGSGGIDLP